MRLYHFHKMVYPLLKWLNLHNVSFYVRSVNSSCHCLVIPVKIDTGLFDCVENWLINYSIDYQFKDNCFYII